MLNPKAVFSCSVALIAALVGASDYSDALDALKAGDKMRCERALRGLLSEAGTDPILESAIRRYLRQPETNATETLRRALELRSGPTQASPTAPALRKAAAEIKSKGGYGDAGVKDSSNWLGRLLTRLFRGSKDEPQEIAPRAVPGLGGWVITAVKVLLVLGVAAFVVIMVSQFRWRRRLRRSASALLDEDEPLRTPDEWLEEADVLAGKFLYREAVRCLYVACLLRADEHGIARFRRHETNWEHLARIEANPRLPSGVDFREPTGRFDRIWYGRQVRGEVDFLQFREWYLQLTKALQAVPA